MLNVKRWKATLAVCLTLGMNGAAMTPIIAPLIAPEEAMAQSRSFRDVPDGYWAEDFIEALVDRGVIAGFPDGTFKPDAPVTRAQFSSMLQGAFNKSRMRSAINFIDVAPGYWANNSIDYAYETGFLAGYPGNIFRPEQNIPREQVLVSLANGLNYSPDAPVSNVLDYYNDDFNISNYARSPIAAATEEEMVVNYPNLKNLNPGRNATRAEVVAFLYQALVSQGNAQTIASPYIVSPEPIATQYKIPAGTQLPVAYEQDKILLTDDETVPVTLKLKTNVTTPDGTLLLPMNSDVKGELRPAGDGTQFVADEIVFPNGETYALDAESQIITKTETINKGTNVGNVLRNAALGTAAAAAIAAVTGDRAIATEEILLGAGAGALTALIQSFLGRNSIDLLVVEPNTNLDLTLDSDLVIDAN